MFEVGQKVVCVDASYTNTINVKELEEGKVYTVSWLGSYNHPNPMIKEEMCVRLKESPRRPLCYDEFINYVNSDMPFAARRFRPLKSTSIEVFKNLLTPVPENIDA